LLRITFTPIAPAAVATAPVCGRPHFQKVHEENIATFVISHAGVWRATASERTGVSLAIGARRQGAGFQRHSEAEADQAPAGGVGLGPTRLA
jgi:hypothetical protein